MRSRYGLGLPPENMPRGKVKRQRHTFSSTGAKGSRFSILFLGGISRTLREEILGPGGGGVRWSLTRRARTQRGVTGSRSRSDQRLIAACSGLTTRNQRSAITTDRTRQFSHDDHFSGAILTMSIVAEIQVVEAYSPRSEEQCIEDNGSEEAPRTSRLRMQQSKGLMLVPSRASRGIGLDRSSELL